MVAAGNGEGVVSVARRVVQVERAFLTQAVGFMLGRGIRQFLDLGCGKPGVGSPHDMGRLTGPAVRVIHVDYDAEVIERARRVIAGTEHRYLVCRNVTDVSGLIETCQAAGMLDARRPTGVVAVGLLHLIPDANELLSRYSAELPRDSVFAASHLTRCFKDDDSGAAAKLIGGPVYPRQRQEIAEMFDGLALVKPGIVALPHEWGTPAKSIAGAPVLAGIAVKQ
ncbi:S-adenosyl methyltransferase [Lentzea waywayandensis]|uniref:S-adenosyl methyltransferase n=1 Tax=Lentzea waywayandensis TaxID=84724 RepID=A0A1I6FJ25_9PSEU|nr:SAM-dependent methyltransferase [Lentzea waywayandensis]SFR29898.1 S-adenosyl methyltransferase [Lentzea waywayandensis]